jgi:cation:H+ antiporter
VDLGDIQNALLAVAAVGVGFTVSVLASRRAVTNTIALAAGTRLPPFVVGFTLLAIGTDLPEIANSIVSSISGHGDLNVGDSVGSAATQATLVLGLLPLIGGAFVISKKRVARIGIATVFALLLGAALMIDGFISRLDAIVLLSAWIIGTAIMWGPPPPHTQLSLQLEAAAKVKKVFLVLSALAVVAAGTTGAVWGLTRLAEAISTPEYVVAFFLASIGTSLPELVVTTTAIRQGQRELAIGDALGSSFLDSTLSIGIGPLIAPVAVTASFAVKGSLAAAGAIGIVALVLSLRGRHDKLSGVAFILMYLGFYVVLLVL